MESIPNEVMCFDKGQVTNPINQTKLGFGLPCHTLHSNTYDACVLTKKTDVMHTIYSMGHDERETQFLENQANPLTACDYKQPPMVGPVPANDEIYSVASDERSSAFKKNVCDTLTHHDHFRSPVVNVPVTESIVTEDMTPNTAGTLVAGYAKCYNDNPFERGYAVAQGKAVDAKNFVEGEINGTLTSASSHNTESNNVVRQQYAVRRLMPIECERLQGLPDNYTFLPGEKCCSDSARYKALGNGMAQPCADFVIRRIVEEVEKERTE